MHTFTSISRKQSTKPVQDSGSRARQRLFAERAVPHASSLVAQLQKSIGNRSVVQLLQMRAQRAAPVQRKSNRTGIPDALKDGIESLSGSSLDDVKVHYNSSKPEQLQALAYAQGSEIHVGPGQEAHLPHEAWHVVQQRQGRVRPTLSANGVPVNDDAHLEHEADVMGAKALQQGGQLQMKASNREPSEAAGAGGQVGTVQKVAVALFDGLDKDKPSTYDVGGGHSYADHGAHTTEEQQRERLKSGTAPSGRVSKVPTGKAASKFASDDKHKAAFSAAYSQLVAKNAPKKNLVGMGGTLSVPGAGIGYLRDGTSVNCDKVQLDIQPTGDKLRINTMFPVN